MKSVKKCPFRSQFSSSNFISARGGYPVIEPPPVKLDESSQRIQQDILTISQKIAEISGEPRSAPSSSPFVVGMRQQAETERKVNSASYHIMKNHEIIITMRHIAKTCLFSEYF